jgi:iron(III) transport system substrate-binding protein
MSRRTRIALLAGTAAVLVLATAGAVVAFNRGGAEELDVYTARSHYGEEAVFTDFAERGDYALTLFGGSAPELYERLRSEGENTSADLLITVDGANLWRAQQAGLLRSVDSPALDAAVPAELRDPDGYWFGLTRRARTVVRSTERVGADDVTSYADLADPRWKGRVCLRTSASEYNTSFVADRIAKDGPEATEALLRGWIANEPRIVGTDTDALEEIAAGTCDLAFVNTYYLGRLQSDEPGFPAAPVWVDQDGRGVHVNLSGAGVVRASDRPEDATALLEYLVEPDQQAQLAASNDEFPVVDGVDPAPEVAAWGDFKADPIDVAGAGAVLPDAVALMDKVGWR